MEAKLGKKGGINYDDEEDDSSDSETEDDGFLATDQVDAEITTLLTAIKNKDPRLKQKGFQWYKSLEDPENAHETRPKAAKPITLRDYQRMNLLKDVAEEDDEHQQGGSDSLRNYDQDQDEIKRSIAEEVATHAEESDGGDDFFKPKKSANKACVANENGIHPTRAGRVAKAGNLPNPDEDPEGFLLKYTTSRAFADDLTEPKWEAFDDDDEEEDDRMEKIELAFNMRFEDPEQSNTLIRTYARGGRSVRREKPTARKARREQERERKEVEKAQHEAERTQLRRLKIEMNQEKLRKIKDTAGMTGQQLDEEEMMNLLEEAWDDSKWEEVMKKRFGEDYYAALDATIAKEKDEEMDAPTTKNGKRKPKKPTWDDEIEINDIVPDFEADQKPTIGLSDIDDVCGSEDAEETRSMTRKKNKDMRKQRQESRRTSRRERAYVEALVDSKMELDDPEILHKATAGRGSDITRVGFRYRETSPKSFGLTARDILLAPSDKSLNEFAGIKKYATFRDETKKRKDKKRLGKKTRVKEWRRENFGRRFAETGPTFGFEGLLGWEGKGVEDVTARHEGLGDGDGDGDGGDGDMDGKGEGKKKKRRRRKMMRDGKDEAGTL